MSLSNGVRRTVFSDFCLKRGNRNRALAWFVYFSAVVFLVHFAKGTSATELIMFESRGCEYCALWNEEIGEIYAETKTGETVPLRRVQMEEKLSEEWRNIKSIRYSPTFVVIEDGREIGRITGYPGEAFFWGYMDEIVAKFNGR